jgi:hypothetical protein
MSFTLRDASTTTDPTLDRIIQFDERSRDYPVAAIAPPPPRKERTWRLDRNRMGDQGREGACVEFGISHAVVGWPKPAALKIVQRVRAEHLIYWEAQRKDPWPGGSYPGAAPRYEGTSVLTGLQVARALGFFGAYHWAFSLDDVIQGILGVGPAVVGLNMTDGMMRARSGGLIESSGPVVGGHCMAAIGIDYARRFPDGRVLDVVIFAQSWGLNYGDQGRVYLPLEQLAERLADDGECAFVTDRRSLKVLPV